MVNLKTQIILRSNFESQHQKIKSRAKRQLATDSKAKERGQRLYLKTRELLSSFSFVFGLKVGFFLKKNGERIDGDERQRDSTVRWQIRTVQYSRKPLSGLL